MKLFERIDMIANKKYGSRAKLAKALGEKQPTFNGYFSSDRQDKFKAIHLERILDRHPEINPIWLLTGEGEMERPYSSQELTQLRNEVAHGLKESRFSPLILQLAQIEEAMLGADDLAKIEAMIALLKGQHQTQFQKRGGYGTSLAARETTGLAHEPQAPYGGDACSIDSPARRIKVRDIDGDRVKE